MKTETLTERTKGEWYKEEFNRNIMQGDEIMCTVPGEDNDEFKRKCLLICKAVNNHDALHDATAILLKVCINQGGTFYNDNIKAINFAMDAIKKAEQ